MHSFKRSASIISESKIPEEGSPIKYDTCKDTKNVGFYYWTYYGPSSFAELSYNNATIQRKIYGDRGAIVKNLRSD